MSDDFDTGILLGLIFSIFVIGLAFNFGTIQYNNNEVKELDSWNCEINFRLDRNVSLYDENYLVDSFRIVFPCNDKDSNNFLNNIGRRF